ncbi:MAG: hypothetical protein ACOC56_01085 [Atribacterota bacterium]
MVIAHRNNDSKLRELARSWGIEIDGCNYETKKEKVTFLINGMFYIIEINGKKYSGIYVGKKKITHGKWKNREYKILINLKTNKMFKLISDDLTVIYKMFAENNEYFRAKEIAIEEGAIKPPYKDYGLRKHGLYSNKYYYNMYAHYKGVMYKILRTKTTMVVLFDEGKDEYFKVPAHRIKKVFRARDYYT